MKLEEYIKGEWDLIYIPEYAKSAGKVQEKAREMFEEEVPLEEIIEYCKQESQRDLANKLKSEANLSKRFATRTFDNFRCDNLIQRKAFEKAKNYTKNIDENLKNGTGIIFVGNGDVGTGKTHLACAIANELLERGYPVKVINITKMIAAIKEDFKIEEYIKVPILLIDDLGKETGTQWVCETLYTIFNERYESMKPIIITTENGLSEIRNNYKVCVNGQEIDRGKSIVSRLCEDFIYVELTGKDYRTMRSN